MLLPTKKLSKSEKQLIKIFSTLGQSDKLSLMAFAEFLSQRTESQVLDEPPPAKKVDIVRPEKESVVAAIKRLSATYPMLDRSLLLTETSSFMTAHVMQGKAADLVINDLESLFEKYYEQHNQQQT